MRMRALLTRGAAIGLGVALTVAMVPATSATAHDDTPSARGARASTIAVYGDSPYGTSNADTAQFDVTVPQADAGVGPFIKTINDDPNVGLVMHIGDIHSGKQYCTQAYDQSIFNAWLQFQDPLVYTPGDNEWADCHKLKQGGDVFSNGNPVDYANGDPVANLALIRSMFFPRPNVTLGTSKRLVVSQKLAYDRRHPADAQFVENVLWVQSGVVFVTMNVPGGSNNDQDIWYKSQRGLTTESPAQTQERVDRTGADLRWLDTAFGLAKLVGAKGVVIGAQADMWDLDGTLPSDQHLAGYEPIVAKVAQRTTDFGRPVLMFNGDSHNYRSDNPLRRGAPCASEGMVCADDAWANHPRYDVPNFHRVVVHGSTAPMEWLKLTVDPSMNAPASTTAFGPFSWSRQIQALP